MNRNARIYVAIVCLAGVMAAGGVYLQAPVVPPGAVTAIAVLSALALVAEMLAFVLPHAARGSVAYIPYFAAVLLSPTWATIVAVVAVKVLGEKLIAAPRIKAIFNVAQHSLLLGAAVTVYLSLGGKSFLSVESTDLASLTKSAGLPAFAAVTSAFLVNAALVSGIVALTSRTRLLDALRQNSLSSMAIDLLATPIIFVFAWAYAAHGPIAALALWVPILGFRQLNKTKLELEQVNRELLELMVTTLEARDPYTSGHSRRVHDYAILIARAMGLPERQVQQIGQAALLHDVGKIYEKYAPILSKTAKLSPEEWAIMQQHPVDGERLVSTMTRLKELTPAIRHHHEQWDGTGYPDGIAGQEIPLGARIIALADTIDAMTSVRPYRVALSPDQVRAELVRCRGQQFDPTLTDHVLSSALWNKLFAPDRPARPSQPQLAVIPMRAGARSTVRG
jgi:HD-GYP domain-containing protein (c-di-GMP phosphodiesterase class II)